MDVLFSNSFIIQNWQGFLTSSLIILLLYALYMRKPRKEFENEPKDKKDTSIYKPALELKPHVHYEGAKLKLPGGAQEFYELMSNRRSVRSFSTKKAAPALEVLETCIKAAGTAPSGAHTEPWTFCLVSSLQLKSEIRDIVEREEEFNYAQRMHPQWTADLQPLGTNHQKPYLTDAPYLILIFKQSYGFLADGQRRQHYYNEISTSIAVGILLAALQAAGLSSLVTTPLNCGPALRKLLSRPDNEKLLVLMPVGYPAEDCLVPDLQRKALKDILIKF